MAKEAQPEADEQFAHAIHKVERECGILIDENFLLMKFWNIVGQCEICDREKEEMESEHRFESTMSGHRI